MIHFLRFIKTECGAKRFHTCVGSVGLLAGCSLRNLHRIRATDVVINALRLKGMH